MVVISRSFSFENCIVLLDELRAASNQCSYVLTFVSVLHRYRALLQRCVLWRWLGCIYGCDKLGFSYLKTAHCVVR